MSALLKTLRRRKQIQPPASFDPDGEGYDYASAKRAGMKPGKTGHWGSVVEVDRGKYLVLKGADHKTFSKTVEAEKKRGYKIVKQGGRYYSVPKGD